ncbi:hypothetical protein INT46_007002 [Mucor plumbeus]|uniref:HTH CENPB-type domain-containing protein n=1 Tax=Mucor plumbeus TaxID=97098 RepID=A0A8H7RB05_9FUNG|nr:hypothetical protein INT46_007002 [Mucor plumbeus]
MAKEQLNKSNLKAAKFPELEKELINYINNMESGNTAIGTCSITTKANILIRQNPDFLKGEEPTMSNGWIYNFLKRHELKHRSMNGESGSLTMTDQIIEKTPEIRNILRDYNLKDIFNMDETGLYYRQAPTKTISRNPVPGVKVDKTRLTIAFFCNAAGTSKSAPIIIGKFKKPRCFKKRTGSELGFSYYHTNKAWMTKDVFRSVMHDFKKRMYRERRKVVLLLDNAPVHEQCDEFSNVKLVFLPANTTSKYMAIATENALIVYDNDTSLKMREDIEVAVREEEVNEGIFDNDTAALIHDSSDDEVEDMEEADDVIPVNEEKILASLGYVTSNFVATNDKNFKILKDMADLYL